MYTDGTDATDEHGKGKEVQPQMNADEEEFLYTDATDEHGRREEEPLIRRAKATEAQSTQSEDGWQGKTGQPPQMCADTR